MAVPTTKTVLVTGSHRGIGLAFAGQFLRLGWRVIATAPNVATAHKLHAMAPHKIVELDVDDDASIARAAANWLHGGEPIDVLLYSDHVSDCSFLQHTSPQSLLKQIETSVISPFLVTRAFLPHLAAAATFRLNGPAIATRVFYIEDTAAKHGCDGKALAASVEQESASGDLAVLVGNMLLRTRPTPVIHVNPGLLVSDLTLTDDGEIPESTARQLLGQLTRTWPWT